MQDLSPGLRRCLAELPVPFAQVLLLVDVEELHYKDAAARLSVPVGTVMSRLHRARRMLRERLEAVAA
jgi:RNA polymerase sigma-70 factor (ECF subfamily)